MKGPAGYGRYDDEPEVIGCPWAKSDMTPCVARDGHICLSSGAKRVCVGCGHDVPFLLADLAKEYAPARDLSPDANDDARADLFSRLVHEATDPLAEANLAILAESARDQLREALSRLTSVASELKHQAATAGDRVEPRKLTAARADIVAMRIALDEAQAVLDSATIPAEPA